MPYNPHCPYTLMFEQNSEGHVIGALIIVPSLDLVNYKWAATNLTRLAWPPLLAAAIAPRSC